jgi:hypothetical protein
MYISYKSYQKKKLWLSPRIGGGVSVEPMTNICASGILLILAFRYQDYNVEVRLQWNINLYRASCKCIKLLKYFKGGPTSTQAHRHGGKQAHRHTNTQTHRHRDPQAH